MCRAFIIHVRHAAWDVEKARCLGRAGRGGQAASLAHLARPA